MTDLHLQRSLARLDQPEHPGPPPEREALGPPSGIHGLVSVFFSTDKSTTIQKVTPKK